MRLRKRLGDILIERGYISERQLRDALQKQEQSGQKLGKILLRDKIVTEQQLAECLAEQFGTTYVPLDQDSVQEAFVRLYPEHLIRKYRFIPLQERNGVLDVAMANPFDLEAVDHLEVSLHKKIRICIATESDIDRTISDIFDREKVLQELGSMPGTEDTDSMYFDLEEDNLDGVPIKQVLNDILRRAVAERASDIHIKANAADVSVKFRIDGVLYNVMTLPRRVHGALVSRIKVMSNMDIAERRIPQDGKARAKIDNRFIDLRVSTLPTVSVSSSMESEKVVIRLLDKVNLIDKLDKIGFQQDVLQQYKNLVKSPYGIILITGPTGSGKSSTLYTTILEINDETKNIITIEDPIEYEIDTVTQVQVNLKTGLTFATGLRSILRQDPDIILVGEIRDKETAEIATRAANTGHLVFSTLHTNDATSAVMRLRDMGVEPFLIASSLLAVVGQRLVRRICENCKEKYVQNEPTIDTMFFGINTPVTLYRGKGCRLCKNTGYRGRVPVSELFVVNGDMRSAIVAGVDAGQLRQMAIDSGMKSMKMDGLEKALAGITTLEEVRKNISVGVED